MPLQNCAHVHLQQLPYLDNTNSPETAHSNKCVFLALFRNATHSSFLFLVDH